jgi:hypothetical protein
MKKFDCYDVLSLAAHIVDMDIDDAADDDFEDQVETQLEEQYGLELETFADLMTALMPLIRIGMSPLTKTEFKGFAHSDYWLLKIQANP